MTNAGRVSSMRMEEVGGILKDMFPKLYINRNEINFKESGEDVLVVFDTNILLDLYQSSSKLRDELMKSIKMVGVETINIIIILEFKPIEGFFLKAKAASKLYNRIFVSKVSSVLFGTYGC